MDSRTMVMSSPIDLTLNPSSFSQSVTGISLAVPFSATKSYANSECDRDCQSLHHLITLLSALRSALGGGMRLVWCSR